MSPIGRGHTAVARSPVYHTQGRAHFTKNDTRIHAVSRTLLAIQKRKRQKMLRREAGPVRQASDKFQMGEILFVHALSNVKSLNEKASWRITALEFSMSRLKTKPG